MQGEEHDMLTFVGVHCSSQTALAGLLLRKMWSAFGSCTARTVCERMCCVRCIFVQHASQLAVACMYLSEDALSGIIPLLNGLFEDRSNLLLPATNTLHSWLRHVCISLRMLCLANHVLVTCYLCEDKSILLPAANFFGSSSSQ